MSYMDATTPRQRRVFLTISAGPTPTEAVEILQTENRGAIDAALLELGGEMRAPDPPPDPWAAAIEQRRREIEAAKAPSSRRGRR